MLEKRKKIILDTDNGDDIDDLIALYFALHLSDKFEIVGIICSFLNTPLRKKQIEHVLKLFNKTDIPVFAGVRKPVNGLHGNDIDTIYCQYFDYLGESNQEEENEAIIFLINKARELQDQLTIVEIAPQTTLATAILKDKKAFLNTPIVLMAGSFDNVSSEWNMECDAFASKVVLESGLNLTYVGSDITLLTTLENPEIEGLLLAKYLDEKKEFLSQSANAWVNVSRRHIVLHDPLALLSVIDRDLCRFEKKNISYELYNNSVFTKIDPNSHFVAKIATNVNLDKLYSYVFDLMKGNE